ncbi:DUF1918 domain-containing protein [Streptomyces chattanoogensis]|uniref:DUF1918 domain-containing protein n=1 Tax=Streptomyces chattanoogensis TaxID=66876 RepID=UPI0005D8614F|nr:hypothetical protein T261_6656 [Streptomyces lydicus]
MHATRGDRLVVHGRIVGQHDHTVEIVEVLGTNGDPPYRVRDANGHESIMSPGPDCVVQHGKSTDITGR